MSNLALFPSGITTNNLAPNVLGSIHNTALQTLYTAPSIGLGARIDHLGVVSSQNATRTLMLLKNKANGVSIRIGTVIVPANSGFNGSVATYYPLKTTLFGYSSNGLCSGLPTDSNGNPYIQLGAGESLMGQVTAAMSAGSSLFFDIHASEF